MAVINRDEVLANASTKQSTIWAIDRTPRHALSALGEQTVLH